MIRAGVFQVVCIGLLSLGVSTAPAAAACKRYVGTVCIDKTPETPKKKPVVKKKSQKKKAVKAKPVKTQKKVKKVRLRDWDAYDWGEMSGKQQKLWAVLGWNASSWSGARSGPATERTRWTKLSTRHRNAAAQLGFSQKTWDAAIKK